jgi:hypothetical protein
MVTKKKTTKKGSPKKQIKKDIETKKRKVLINLIWFAGLFIICLIGNLIFLNPYIDNAFIIGMILSGAIGLAMIMIFLGLWLAKRK